MQRMIAATLLWLFSAGGAEAGVETAEMRTELTFGHGTSDTSAIQLGLDLIPAVELGFDNDARLVLSARLRWDDRDRLVPGEPDTSTYGRLSRPWTPGEAGTAELRDAYLELGLGTGVLRIGKQQIVWGALDGLKILDAVNPQSFREFILDEFGDSRIGLWSVYADLSLGGWRAELAWLPDATGHEIPVEGAWFELTAPRFRYGAQSDAPRLPTRTERPGVTTSGAGAGLRLSRMLGVWDISAVALTGQDPEPLGRVEAASGRPVLERYYARRELYGLSAATAVGRIALRAELALRPGRRFNRLGADGLVTEALDQYTGGIGIDIRGPLDTFVNLQYLVDHVQSAPDGLVRPPTDRLITVFLRRAFAYDTVTTELRWYGETRAGDGLLRASIAWLIGDETTLRLGADIFHGERTGLFGQFADRDRITLSLEHVF